MTRWQVLAAATAGCALTIILALHRDADVLAGVSALATLATVATGVVGWLKQRLTSERTSIAVSALVICGAITAPAAVALLPARVLGGGIAPPATPSPASPAAVPTSTATPTADARLVRYCELAIEFLGDAQRFSGKGWQGSITRRDFDPIVRTLNAALETAPEEMRAPLTVLASSYEAAQADWSDDDIIHNIGVALGTILSPSARAAADAVDAFENEHCF